MPASPALTAAAAAAAVAGPSQEAQPARRPRASRPRRPRSAEKLSEHERTLRPTASLIHFHGPAAETSAAGAAKAPLDGAHRAPMGRRRQAGKHTGSGSGAGTWLKGAGAASASASSSPAASPVVGLGLSFEGGAMPLGEVSLTTVANRAQRSPASAAAPKPKARAPRRPASREKKYHIPAASLTGAGGAGAELSGLGIYFPPASGSSEGHSTEYHSARAGPSSVDLDLDLSFDFISRGEARGKAAGGKRRVSASMRAVDVDDEADGDADDEPDMDADIESGSSHAVHQLLLPVVSLTTPSPSKAFTRARFDSPSAKLPEWLTEAPAISPERPSLGSSSGKQPTPPKSMASASWTGRAKRPPPPLSLDPPRAALPASSPPALTLTSVFSPELSPAGRTPLTDDDPLPVTPLSATRRGQAAMELPHIAVEDEFAPGIEHEAAPHLTRSWSTKASLSSSNASFPPPSAPPTVPLPPLPASALGLDLGPAASPPEAGRAPRTSFPPEAAYELVKDAKTLEEMEELLEQGASEAGSSLGHRQVGRSASRRRVKTDSDDLAGEGHELLGLGAPVGLRSLQSRKSSGFSPQGDRNSVGSASTFETAEEGSMRRLRGGSQSSHHGSSSTHHSRGHTKVLSAAARYELAIAGLRPPPPSSSRHLSATDSSPNTQYSDFTSEPMLSVSSRYSQTTAPSTGSMRIKALPSPLEPAWQGSSPALPPPSGSDDVAPEGPRVPALSLHEQMHQLRDSVIEEEPLTKQWVEEQRKSLQLSSVGMEKSPSGSTLGSSGSRSWDADLSTGPKQTLVVTTSSGDEGPLFVTAPGGTDASGKEGSLWTQSPLLLAGQVQADTSEGSSLGALGLVLGPSAADPARHERASISHASTDGSAGPAPADDAKVEMARSSSSLDGFACNVTPPIKAPPRDDEDTHRPPSGLKNIIASAVLQSPTTPSRISAMFNKLGGKGKADSVTSPESSVRSPIASPPMRQNSMSIRPLALVEKKTKEARRVSLGWHQRSMSKDIQNLLASPKADGTVMPAAASLEEGDLGVRQEPRSPPGAGTAPPQRPSRHTRRVSRLGYVSAKGEIRLDMGNALDDAPPTQQSLTGNALELLRSPRAVQSPAGMTPEGMLSPPLGQPWTPAMRSSPLLPGEAGFQNNVTSPPSSPWLDFDGSILAARPSVASPAATQADRFPATAEQLGHFAHRASVRFRGARQSMSGRDFGPASPPSKPPEVSFSPFGDHPYHHRKKRHMRLSLGTSADLRRALSTSALRSAALDSILPSKAMFYAGFLGMPWLWLLGGWWLDANGQMRVDQKQRVSVWTHQPSVQAALEKDFAGSPAALHDGDATFASKFGSSNDSAMIDESLTVDTFANVTNASSTSRTLQTAFSRMTLGTFYATGPSSLAATSQPTLSHAASSVRIPRRHASVDSLISPKPEVAYFQSPVRVVPSPSAAMGSLGAASRAQSTLQILVEDPLGEARRNSELTAAEERDYSTTADVTSSTVERSATSATQSASVQQLMKHRGLLQWSHLERYVLLNRVFAIVGTLVVMAGWSAALATVAGNF